MGFCQKTAIFEIKYYTIDEAKVKFQCTTINKILGWLSYFVL